MSDTLDTRRQHLEQLRRRVAELQSTHSALESELAGIERQIAQFPTVDGQVAPPNDPGLDRSSHGAILMYHRVSQLDPDPYSLCMPPEQFRTQMELLARTCEPISLDDMVTAVRRGAIPRRAVALTFDDGYLDALTASDILTDLHLPATFYLNSYFGGEGWHDGVARVFLGAHALPARMPLAIGACDIDLPSDTPQARRAAFDAVREIGWSLSAEGRRTLMRALFEWSGVDESPRDTHRTLVANEVRELASRPGHQIGAHTGNHLCLPAHPRSVKVREMVDNLVFLEETLGTAVTSFAFPYGIYDAECVEICRGMGLRSAVTVEQRTVRAWDDLVRLPRLEVSPRVAGEFEAFVTRLFA
jgi:peptidoglycan/xylan/chitin deacetylase (PgdA/CDA1 family)